jgi:2-polyprenyl-3-methyl-5-hydroxy-6-metoxy-1,4-benzoquinol methylase
MAQSIQAKHWDDVYNNTPLDSIPWELDWADHALVSWMSTQSGITTALEIGCGTGINSIWLAQQGIAVTGIDAATSAIQKSQDRTCACGVDVNFQVADILDLSLTLPKFDLVFDRACFHVLHFKEDQQKFAGVVENLLTPHGRWVSIIGSTENQHNIDANSRWQTPRRTLVDIVQAVEPSLKIDSVHAIREPHKNGNYHPFWMMIASKRSTPALLSSHANK